MSSNQNIGGIRIDHFEIGKSISLSVKKGLSSKKLKLDQNGVKVTYKSLFGAKSIQIPMTELLNEKPPVVAYINKHSDNLKVPVSLIINYFDGSKWNEFTVLNKLIKEAERTAITLNEKLATLHFS